MKSNLSSRQRAISLSLLLLIGSATAVQAEDAAIGPAVGAVAPAVDTPKTEVKADTVPKTVDMLAVPEGSQAPVLKWRPGQTLTTTTDTEDIIATYDIDLAQKQVAAYPDSPEASFILAVALTRTSRVEEALKEVQRARKLTETKGGPAYFDKMIKTYEDMLKSYPDDNRVRYGLAWAYYMKAYLLAQHSRRVAKWKAVNEKGYQANQAYPQPQPQPIISNADVKNLLNGKTDLASGAVKLAAAAQALSSGKPQLSQIPHIPSALEKVEPQDVPQIKQYYELALQRIDDLLKREPDDVWATVYRAHLNAEYTGNLEAAMGTWRKVQAKNPNNPAAYFFLGEGYLKQGNLKESINHVSRAIALRALGN